MTREEIINNYIEEASKHGADEVECCIAGWREDVHKDFYTWGEILDSLITQEGWVWENHTKRTVEIIHLIIQKFLTKEQDL